MDFETVVGGLAIMMFLAIWIGSTLYFGFLGFALGWLPALVVINMLESLSGN